MEPSFINKLTQYIEGPETKESIELLPVQPSASLKLERLRDSPYPSIILGLTGSVASIKANEMVELILSECHHNVIVIQTESSTHFT